MPTARAAQVDYSVTQYYHLMSRCVRRSYLCGIDKDSGQDYSHRKQWLIDRIKFLSSIFAIHICAYAIMSNHYHLVLYVNTDMAQNWSADDVLSHWTRLFGPTRAKEINSLPADLAENEILELRNRLSSISWFMRCLNENIARRSNEEDGLDGRFWQGRFKSQALLDEGAVLSAMAYVDLNPIRAKQANTPEESEFTSIYERIQTAYNTLSMPQQAEKNHEQPLELMPFSDADSSHPLPTIDFTFSDYLQLVDTTGRILREDKPGYILNHHQAILTRLNLSPKGWLHIVQNLETNFCHVLGNHLRFDNFAKKHRVRAPVGKTISKQCYLSSTF